MWVLLVTLVVILAVRWWRCERFVKLSNKVTCSIKRYPFIGHGYLFMGGGAKRMQTFQKFGREAIKAGGMTSMWLGDKFYVVAVDPIDIEVIMNTALEKDSVMRFARKLIGNGIIFAPVAIWRPRRKCLAPAFNAKNLNNFVEIFVRQSSIMVEQLKTVAGTGAVSIGKYLTSYTLDSVCEMALGIELNAQRRTDEPFSKSFEACCKLIAARMLQPWLYPDVVYNLLPYQTEFLKNKDVVCNLIDEAIRSKRKELKENKGEGNIMMLSAKVAPLFDSYDTLGMNWSSDVKYSKSVTTRTRTVSKTKSFLGLLIEASGGDNGYTDLELHEESLVLVVASTDTSAAGASFVISMMARHPDIQEKVVQELEAVFGSSDRPVTVADLPRLKYLDAVIKETLRLYPPVPVIVREIEKDIELPSGLTLINGCGVLVNIWATHRNPVYWGEDAEQFRPERFIEAPPKHSAAYLVFSHGPRNCLGYQLALMSIKTAIATLLRHYSVSSVDGTTDGAHHVPIKLKFDVMMKDVDGFKVKLETRTKSKDSI